MPSQVEILTQKVAELTQLVNSINTDAKTNDELPLQNPFNILSKIRVYANATSEIITAQDIINFILTQTGNNKFIVTTGSTLAGNNLTINDSWQWNIQGNYYFNPADVVLNIPFAATGKSRIDLIVANKSNTFTRIAGAESILPASPVSPTIPSPSDDTLLAYFITVREDYIAVPIDPPIGKYLNTWPNQSAFEDAILEGFVIGANQYGSFGFVLNTGVLKLFIYDGTDYQYFDLLSGGSSSTPLWADRTRVRKGLYNTNQSANQINDVFSFGMEDGVTIAIYAVWNGGTFSEDTSFDIRQTIDVPETTTPSDVWDDSETWDDTETW